jgi:hypothetical protein
LHPLDSLGPMTERFSILLDCNLNVRKIKWRFKFRVSTTGNPGRNRMAQVRVSETGNPGTSAPILPKQVPPGAGKSRAVVAWAILCCCSLGSIMIVQRLPWLYRQAVVRRQNLWLGVGLSRRAGGGAGYPRPEVREVPHLTRSGRRGSPPAPGCCVQALKVQALGCRGRPPAVSSPDQGEAQQGM